MKNRSSKGFSLVEITIAIGIVAFAMLAIAGLIPVGMNSARDAGNDTRTSMIAQDVYNRIRAKPNSSYTFSAYATGEASYFFYTNDGIANGELLRVTASSDKPSFYGNITRPSHFYRAKVVVSTIDPAAQTSYPSYDPRKGSDFLCATVEIGWPANTKDGGVLGTASAAKATYVFYLRKP